MADWLFWWTLAAMLWAGHLFGTGIFLSQFSLAALFSGAAALAYPGHLDEQLHLFIFLSLVQALFARRALVRRRAGSRRPPRR